MPRRGHTIKVSCETMTRLRKHAPTLQDTLHDVVRAALDALEGLPHNYPNSPPDIRKNKVSSKGGQIRISCETMIRMQKHALPLQDTTHDVVRKALDALEGLPPKPRDNNDNKDLKRNRTIRISCETMIRMQKHALPLQDTANDVVRKVLDALEGLPPKPRDNNDNKDLKRNRAICISIETMIRLQKHALPLQDTANDVVRKVLDALEKTK